MSTKHEVVLCELAKPAEENLESYSPFCLKIHRALRAAGIEYTSRHGHAPDSFKKENPAAQVPVLVVDGKAICDSTRILEWIVSVAPDAISSSAEAWLWEEFADTSINPYLVAARWGDDRNWPVVREAYFASAPGFVRALVAPRIRARIVGYLKRDLLRVGPDACWRRFELVLDRLDERAPREGFFCGPTISVADLSLFGQLHGMRFPLTAWQAEQIAARPSLSAYLDRVDFATRSQSSSADIAHAAE